MLTDEQIKQKIEELNIRERQQLEQFNNLTSSIDQLTAQRNELVQQINLTRGRREGLTESLGEGAKGAGV